MNLSRFFATFVIGLVLTGVSAGQATTRDNGIDLYREGKFDEAVKSLVLATKADKTDRQAWLFLCAAYEHLGRHDNAMDACWNSRIIQKTNLPRLDTQANIISKANIDLRNSGPTPIDNMSFIVAVELRKDGKVGVIIPFHGPPHDYDRLVIDAAKKTVFEPAVKDGQPVSVIQVISYHFTRR